MSCVRLRRTIVRIIRATTPISTSAVVAIRSALRAPGTGVTRDMLALCGAELGEDSRTVIRARATSYPGIFCAEQVSVDRERTRISVHGAGPVGHRFRGHDPWGLSG